MASISSFRLSFFFSFFFFFFSLVSNFSIVSSLTLSLSHFHTNPSQNSYQNLNFLVSSSLTRALHLKHPQSNITTQLSSHSYGGYSISLSFGTPPQTIPFILDTGSDVVWFPCTSHYVCKNCSFSRAPPEIPTFIPKQSSSSKILGCHNPKCSWIHHRNLQCRGCGDEPTSTNCTQVCPSYLIFYGSGVTGGIALSETLNLPNKTIPDFLVGCSVFSYRQPAGIAGFGRSQTSLPSQLNLNKFSYCLLSHKFDDTTRTSSLVLDSGSDSYSGMKTTGLSYTPLIKNPRVPGRSSFSVYYYIGLRRITVGGQRVKVPYKYLEPDNDGNGGTIIDSGTTFTFMPPQVLEPLANEFIDQMKKNKYTRAFDVEDLTGLRPCFNIPAGYQKGLLFPELKLHFKGGTEVALPPENYFAVVGEGSAVCLTVVTDKVESVGPAIILGNFQMQNYYLEYDLRNERIGFKQQVCK